MSSSTTALEADVCIIGSGPAAITVALQLAKTNASVILLTGGSPKETLANRDLYRGSAAEGSTHEPLEENRRRQFGGASAAWGGRCIPFDPIDFEERPWIPESGWPFGAGEIDPHYKEANRLCEAGDPVYDVRLLDPGHTEILPGMDDDTMVSWPMERWSPPVNFGKHYLETLQKAGNVRVMMDAHATGLRLAPDGSKIECVDAVVPGSGSYRVSAKCFVLACGGLENPRLLLASNDVARDGIGNHSDCVGRYYMSHLFGATAEVRFRQPEKLIYDLERDREGVYFRRRWWVTPETQRREEIGNAIMFLFRPLQSAAIHRDPLFSSVYLANYLRGLVRSKNINTAMSRLKEDRQGLGEHAKVVVRDLPTFIPSAMKIAVHRFLKYRRLPFVLPPKKNNLFHLFYQTEHLPNRESRVTLADEIDSHGMPRLKAHVAFQEKDYETVIAAHRIFTKRMSEGGYGEISIDLQALRARLEGLPHAFNSGAHHIGTTRMSSDPAHGVVDPDCRVHHVENLYIAGASVFPTSGHANPTLVLVALADRLGCHLRERLTS